MKTLKDYGTILKNTNKAMKIDKLGNTWLEDIKIITREGLSIEISRDDCYLLEDLFQDGLELITNYRCNYSLGQIDTSLEDFVAAYSGVGGTEHLGPWDSLLEYALEDTYDVYLPVYLYSHSGVKVNTNPFNCRWDSGQIGFVGIRKENVKDWAEKKSVRESILNDTIKTLDHYINGKVWRFLVESQDKEHYDSCGGFIGETFNDSGMLEYLDDNVLEALMNYFEV